MDWKGINFCSDVQANDLYVWFGDSWMAKSYLRKLICQQIVGFCNIDEGMCMKVE